jgi:hypothetical protein
MNKNEKELEQISTTDKLKAFKALKDAGLKVEFGGSGVPTVICASASDMEKELKNIKKILKDLRYNGSFGVRGPRKTDGLLSESGDTAAEIEAEAQIEESTDNSEQIAASIEENEILTA